eukprot:SAG22_NODE_2154_length_2921_cov_1.131467_4_plen_130_part_00
MLRVHIYQGRNLPSADPNGLSDPFMKASCAGQWADRSKESLQEVRTKALSFCCASTVFLSKTVPFLAVSLDRQDTDPHDCDRRHRTKIRYETVNPMWYETLEFKQLENLPCAPEENEDGGVMEIWPNRE